MDELQRDVTLLLQRVSAGDSAAAPQLAAALYDQLRDTAARQLGRAAREHTLQPTAVVHEVFLKVCGGSAAYNDRAHFFAVAARAMRQILINYARDRSAKKRGAGTRPEPLMLDAAASNEKPLDLLDLHDALEELAAIDERKHRVVELRFFGGLSMDEIAEVLAVSKTTIESEWRAARAWLAVRLTG